MTFNDVFLSKSKKLLLKQVDNSPETFNKGQNSIKSVIQLNETSAGTEPAKAREFHNQNSLHFHFCGNSCPYCPPSQHHMSVCVWLYSPFPLEMFSLTVKQSLPHPTKEQQRHRGVLFRLKCLSFWITTAGLMHLNRTQKEQAAAQPVLSSAKEQSLTRELLYSVLSAWF